MRLSNHVVGKTTICAALYKSARTRIGDHPLSLAVYQLQARYIRSPASSLVPRNRELADGYMYALMQDGHAKVTLLRKRMDKDSSSHTHEQSRRKDHHGLYIRGDRRPNKRLAKDRGVGTIGKLPSEIRKTTPNAFQKGVSSGAGVGKVVDSDILEVFLRVKKS